MNPRERLLRTLRGEEADRVPLELTGFECASHAELDSIEDPLRRRVARRIIDETAFRVSVPSGINRFLITPPQRIRTEEEELPGGHVRTRGVIDAPLGELTFEREWAPESGTSWTVKYPVESERDIEKIASVPWELPEGLAPPEPDALPEEFGERGILSTSISSPCVCVAGMMRYEMYLELCIANGPLIERRTEMCRQRVLDCLEVLLSKPGIERVWMGGSEWLTPPMASPAIYRAFVQEQERSIIRYVHEKSDAVVHIHCHGRVRGALPLMIERGGDYTEPVEPPPDGDITMAEAKELAAGRITLGGNVEARVLCNGSEEEVERAVRSAFEGGKDRFVLRPTAGPSPSVSEREFRNYMRLVDVWEELSPV